jgi:hypothetical protein
MTLEPIATSESPPSPPAQPPRVWTVFVAYIGALVLAVLLRVIAVAAVMLWLLARGVVPPQLGGEIQSIAATPTAFILLGLLGQAGIGLAAIIPARLAPEPALRRLRLVKPALPVWGYPTDWEACGFDMHLEVSGSNPLAATRNPWNSRTVASPWVPALPISSAAIGPG